MQMKLIDKDALVAELEKRRNRNSKNKLNIAAALEDNYLLSFLNTFELKEVDLDKALSDLDKDIKEFVTTEEFENESTIMGGHYWVIAKHAFLLGLKAQKGEEL